MKEACTGEEGISDQGDVCHSNQQGPDERIKFALQGDHDCFKQGRKDEVVVIPVTKLQEGNGVKKKEAVLSREVSWVVMNLKQAFCK